jgi:hypothetical protein
MSKPLETPIERIFRKVMGRRMPQPIKAVLLRQSDADSSPNVTDYPTTMSQWEKESLAAEARLSLGKKRRKRAKGTRDCKPPR